MLWGCLGVAKCPFGHTNPKSWFLPESKNWFLIPCWTSGFLRFVTKLKLNKHFNMLASYRSSMFFVQKTELTLGISISVMEPWEEQGPEKYFVRDQKSAAQRWNRTPFALSPKKIPALYQGGKGLGRVSPSPLWWGERAGKAFVFLLKCWMLFSQVLKNRQTSVIKLFAELQEPHLFVSDSKLACSESKEGSI